VKSFGSQPGKAAAMPQKLTARAGQCSYPGCTDRINVGHFCFTHFQHILKNHVPPDVIAKMIEDKEKEVKVAK